MLASCSVVTFVCTTDPVKARRFYGETLNLKFTGEDEFAVVFDANGIMLRVSIMRAFKAAEHTVLGWSVPDIYAAATDLKKAGVKFEKYSFLEQDEIGVWNAPDGTAKVAWFKDPDGNVLSISQHQSAD